MGTMTGTILGAAGPGGPQLREASKTIYEPYTVSTIAGWGSNEHTVDGPPNVAEFSNPDGVVIDKAGNVFVSEYYGETIRKITPAGVASTFAGAAGQPGSADGTGADARFSGPAGMTIAADGTIYLVDSFNETIRKITPGAVVTTLAGSPGQGGFVNGVGSAARFYDPHGITLDKSGNLFVADTYNYAIREITPDGTVSTYAGGTRGSTNGPGASASFDAPTDVAADSLGNLYVAENADNFDVRKIDADDIVSTFASGLGFPIGLAVDASQNVFVGNGTEITEITPGGGVSTFAGGRFGSADGVGTEAEFAYAMRIGVDGAGNFYVSDAHEDWGLWSNETIRKITPAAVVTTLSGVSDMGSRDGVGEAARFFYPEGAVVAANGTLFIADTYNDTIRRIAPDGTVSTFAGKVQTPGDVDGSATEARFNGPATLALDQHGNLFVADEGNGTIRKITPSGQVITLANGYAFKFPEGVAVDRAGTVYVGDSNDNTIEKIAPSGEVTVLAGSPGKTGAADGKGSKARFSYPAGIALDSTGNIYVADENNNAIRKVTPRGVVTTLAGGRGQGSRDGKGSLASFRGPTAVAVDAAGNVFVSDYGNSTLRKVTAAGFVTTLAGLARTQGWVDDTGAAARFVNPFGITVDAAGSLYLCDVNNDTIRKAVPASK